MSTFQKPPTVSDDYRAVDLYRKAAEVIFRKGFNGTSMGDIAEAVDLTKGGLYYYIKGKKALLFAIMSFALDLLENEVFADSGSGIDPVERLRSMISGHLKVVLRDPSAMTLLIDEEEHLSNEHREKVAARKLAYTRSLRDAIQDLQEFQNPPSSGASQPVDAMIAAQSLIGMVHWTVRWYSGPRTEADFQRIADHLTRLALQGVQSGSIVVSRH